jgi:hypothetical protein
MFSHPSDGFYGLQHFIPDRFSLHTLIVRRYTEFLKVFQFFLRILTKIRHLSKWRPWIKICFCIPNISSQNTFRPNVIPCRVIRFLQKRPKLVLSLRMRIRSQYIFNRAIVCACPFSFFWRLAGENRSTVRGEN